MSEFIAGINQEQNWIQVYDEVREVAIAPDGGYVAFPVFELPFLFDQPLMAVRCLVPGAPISWRFAGNLTQKFQIGSGGVGSTLPYVEARRVPLRINRTELVYFQMFTPQYELVLDNPYWIQKLQLTIWEYIGVVDQLTETVIAKMSPQLDRIEAGLQP